MFIGPLQGQDRLTLKEAIGIGLENNFNLRVFENRLQIAENNRSLGNAGFLPSLELTGMRSESVEDSEFETGTERQTTTGARSTTTSAAVNLDWTLFDGLQMFRSYDLLGELEKVSDRERRFQMENLVSNITASYYDIVR